MRIRFILFAALALIAVVPLAYFAYFQQSKALEREIEEVAERYLLLARNIGHALQRYDRDLRAVFLFAAKHAISNPLPDNIDDVTKGLHIRHLCITRRDDPTVVHQAAINNSPCPTRVPAARFELLRSLAQAEKVNYSPALASPSGQPTIYLVALIDDFLAIGAIETTYFVELGNAIAFGKKGHAAIVDSSGHVLAHPSAAWRKQMRDISKVAPVKRMIEGQTGISQFSASDAGRDGYNRFHVAGGPVA